MAMDILWILKNYLVGYICLWDVFCWFLLEDSSILEVTISLSFQTTTKSEQRWGEKKRNTHFISIVSQKKCQENYFSSYDS